MNKFLMLTVSTAAAFGASANAADYKTTCSRGGDARIIEVVAPGSVGQSCDVRYTRSNGSNVSVPYHADSASAFCDEKARAMAQRLISAGFSCQGAAPALRADAAPQSDYVVETKRAAPVAPAPQPAQALAQQSALTQPAPQVAQTVAAVESSGDDDVADLMNQILSQPASDAAQGAPAQLVASPATISPSAPQPSTVGRIVGAAPETPRAFAAAEPQAAMPVTQAGLAVAPAPEQQSEPAPAQAPVQTPQPKPVVEAAPPPSPQAVAQPPAQVAAVAPKPAASAAARGPRDVVVATLMAQAAAWNEGDLDGFMNGYVKDDSLRFVSGGTVIKGWNAVMKRYRDAYQGANGFGQLGFDKLEVRLVTDDVAVVTGQFNLTQNGALTSGLFSLVMRRADGVWRIVHDHTTSG